MPRRVVRFAAESLQAPKKVYGFLNGDVATISWSVEGCMQVRWVASPMATSWHPPSYGHEGSRPGPGRTWQHDELFK